MNIRKRILLSYMILVLLVIAYSSIIAFISAIQRRIDKNVTDLYHSREIWNDLLISMNELQINWSDGDTFVKFRETSDDLENLLNKIAVTKPFQIPFLDYNPGQRKIALYNTWSIAKESVLNIIRLVESQDFQRVISPIEKRPGLQRLNHLWMELFYLADDEMKKDAYVIGQVIDSIEFFPIYSETLNSFPSYEAKAALCKRPEELDQAWLYEPVWAAVNRHYSHLSIKAHSHQELIEQL